MKRSFIFLFIMILCMQIDAQDRQKIIQQKMEKTDSVSFLHPNTSGTYPQPTIETMVPELPKASSDSLHLPPFNSNGQVLPINMYPYSLGGWYNWDLHRGLNINLSASVFGFFGKNAPTGAGFTQSLSAMYAMPLSQKLSLAVGGYLNNMIWSRDTYRDAGFSAVLGYRFNDHWEAYIYGQKSITHSPGMPYTLYDIGHLGDRIGAAVKYNFNPSFSVQLSVEHGWMPKQDMPYNGQYNYPVPK